MSTPPDKFPTDAAGLPEAAPTELVELADGDEFDLRIAPVAKRLGDAHGADARLQRLDPRARPSGCKQGSEIVVNIENQGDLEAHRPLARAPAREPLRRDPRDPGADGGRRELHRARSRSPIPGVYWYHPHIREDYGQEMGLYGNVLVEPADPDYWPPVNRELALTLDDILLEDGSVAPFSRTETTHVAMGRFGDVLLVSGEPDLALTAQRGEVVRFYLTNTANTRVFKVALPGARMKLVGGDSGHVEHEQFVDDGDPGAVRAGGRGRAVRRAR